MNRGLLLLFLVLAGTGWMRLTRLELPPLRADELNFYMGAERNLSLVELWRKPPWLEHIPFADSIPILWSRAIRSPVTAGLVRQPFALLGVATVALCALWLWRKAGLHAALLAAFWLGLLPFHVYESREAYYYAVLMFFAAGFFLRGVDMLQQLRAHKLPLFRLYAEWSVWLALACLVHMTAWPVAAISWLAVLLYGWKWNRKTKTARIHFRNMASIAALLALFMSRWVYRAILKTYDITEAVPLLGGDFWWVTSRLIPMFSAGANIFGTCLAAALALLAVRFFWCSRRNKQTGAESDELLLTVTYLMLGGFLASFVYILLVGGGVGKFTYYAANLPAFIVWAALLVNRSINQELAEKWRTPVCASACLLLGLILAPPAWAIVNLEGKPTPYKILQKWLDENLPEGSVLIVDRWFEPWNEMARYAPSNVVVTFTVPDEPYSAYVEGRWRGITQKAFETGQAQAFIRMTRNHEEKAGVWSFPERFFARKAGITNDAGLWLRHHRFAPGTEYYAANTNRLIVEIFYNTDEDWADRARRGGMASFLLYGPGWGHIKPWRPQPGWPEQLLQTLWIQAGAFGERGLLFSDLGQINRLGQHELMGFLNRGRWADYRLASPDSTLRVFNLTDHPLDQELSIVGIALSGPIRVRAGRSALDFPATHLVERRIPLKLEPGEHAIRFAVQPNQLLLVYNIAVHDP